MAYLKADDFRQYTFLSGIKYSPDGACMALLAKQANDNNGYNSMLYVHKGGGFTPLTNSHGNVASFLWLDQENILFCENRDLEIVKKKEQGFQLTSYFKININGGEAEKAFDIAAEVTDIHLLPDGKFLIAAYKDYNYPELAGLPVYEQEKLLAQHQREQKNYHIIEELPYWTNGGSFISRVRKQLFLYDLKVGLIPLMPEDSSVENFKPSPCGKKVAFEGVLESTGIRPLKRYIYLLDIASGEITTVTDAPLFITKFDFWKNSLLLAAAEDSKYDIHGHPTFTLIDLATREKKVLCHYDRSIGTAVGTDCSMGGGIVDKVYQNGYYFVSLDGYHADIFRLCLETGNIENITQARGSIEMFDIYEDNLCTVGFLEGRLQEIYTFHKDGQPPHKESGFNDAIYDSIKHPRIEHHILTDEEGVSFDGWAMLPVDYDKRKKYPAILNIHGGPKGAYGEIYFHEMQYWANRNYFVFFSNPRGSDGKGNEFAYLRGLYGTIDYDNLMSFTDKMLETYPAADPERVGVTGGSYGGYMTNWIIGHTHRFAAAATQRSICNWFSYMIGDLGYFFTDYDVLANPWNHPEKLWDNSPLKYINNAKTPTLILHSEEDYRCCVPEAYQLFTALKLHNVDTRLCLFHGENHGLSRGGKPDNRTKRLEEITNWMDHYLKHEAED